MERCLELLRIADKLDTWVSRLQKTNDKNEIKLIIKEIKNDN